MNTIDPEVVAMASKMNETIENTVSDVAKQPTNDNINRVGSPVSVPIPQITDHTQNTRKEDLPEKLPSEDLESSIIPKFGIIAIGSKSVPYVSRIINGESLMFVSVRMAEAQLLKKYLPYLHSDFYTYKLVQSYYITEPEAKVLNLFNLEHCKRAFGKDPLVAAKDYMVRLNDVCKFYKFIKCCLQKLLYHTTPGPRQKCGFIRINGGCSPPFCNKNNQKYVPLFYFEGETENLRHRAVKLRNWDLAYLQFCCKVQGIRNEHYAGDSCTVINLEDIKRYYSPETIFEDFWPTNLKNIQKITHLKNVNKKPLGAWIKVPHTIIPATETSSTADHAGH